MMFSTQTYVQRRQVLSNVMKTGILVFPGNGQSSMNFKDNWHPYRQDSSFLYYTGVNVPDLYFIIDLDSGREILFGDDITPEQIVWTGPIDPLTSWAERAGIAEVQPCAALGDYLASATQKGASVHYLPPYRPETEIQLSTLLSLPIAQVPEKASVPLIEAVVAQRAVKSDEEIADIEKAINVTRKMHQYAIQHTRPGVTEKEIAGALQQIAIAGGGNLSFPTILTKDGQYLHNHASEQVLSDGDLVICDAGAETNMGYAGDMTRTFPVSAQFTSLQRDMYDIVLKAHDDAIAALKPGVKFKDIHLLAAKTLVEGLKDMGVMKGDADEAVAAGAHTLFFQCGLGHMMGLDVHDMESLGEQYVGYTPDMKKSTEFGLRSLRLGKALEKGYVVTIEPGLYFNPYLTAAWKAEQKYADFVKYDEAEKLNDFGGIRIEDDYLITDSGSQLLGEPLANKADEVEALKAAL